MSELGGRMSGLEGKTSGCSVAWRRMSGLLAGFPGWGRMSGPCRLGYLGCCCCGCSRGRMSGAWKVNLPVSVGSLHP